MYNLDEFVSKNIEHSKKLPLKNAEINYYPNFISDKKANHFFQKLLKETPWQQDDIKVFGKIYPQPRLTALYGTEGKSYTYSGITMYPKKFTKDLFSIQEEIETVIQEKFNTVLLNLYRNGNDSNGWHSDNEKELGVNPVIASVSFGAKRYFHLKNKTDSKQTFKLTLDHGSLLLMAGETQHYWQHQLPKTKLVKEPRINLTFRKIVS
jgi:alkylated DNA repair dioxygenase AlkB